MPFHLVQIQGAVTIDTGALFTQWNRLGTPSGGHIDCGAVFRISTSILYYKTATRQRPDICHAFIVTAWTLCHKRVPVHVIRLQKKSKPFKTYQMFYQRSLPSSAEVKNEWSWTSSSPVCLHGVDTDKSAFSVLLVSTQGQRFWMHKNRFIVTKRKISSWSITPLNTMSFIKLVWKILW